MTIIVVRIELIVLCLLISAYLLFLSTRVSPMAFEVACFLFLFIFLILDL